MLAMTSSVRAQAADDCISEQEISALVIYLMPQVMTAAQARCKAQLAPDGFLAQHGPAMAQRYSDKADAAWPLAKSAFMKFAGSSKDKEMSALASVPDSSVRGLLDGFFEQKIAEEIQPKSCRDIEHLAEVVNHIDPDTTGTLIGVIAALALGKKDKPHVCKNAA